MTTTDRSSHGDAPQSHLMIVAGPQGIGKTYLANGLRERGTEFVIAPGVVTRPARGDQDGNDIQVTAEQFQRMSDKGELCLEAVVGQERYGYLQEGIVRELESGQRVVLLLLYADDVLRALHLWPAATRIYLRPADWKLIRERLSAGRGYNDHAIESCIRRGREVVAELDELQWDLRIDMGRDTDQVGAVLHILSHPT